MKPKPNLVAVQIEEDVHRLVEAIASVRGVELSAYISQIIRPVAESDYAKLSQLMGRMRRHEPGPQG